MKHIYTLTPKITDVADLYGHNVVLEIELPQTVIIVVTCQGILGQTTYSRGNDLGPCTLLKVSTIFRLMFYPVSFSSSNIIRSKVRLSSYERYAYIISAHE